MGTVTRPRCRNYTPPHGFLTRALLRAASPHGTIVVCSHKCRDESRHGTQECVRHGGPMKVVCLELTRRAIGWNAAPAWNRRGARALRRFAKDIRYCPLPPRPERAARLTPPCDPP